MPSDSNPPKDGTSVLSRADLQMYGRPTAEGAGAISGSGAYLGIGYADDNDLIIKDPHVSAHHCRLWRDADRLVLEDLSATNGTFVNGERITLKEVVVGDSIMLARYAFDLSESIIGRLPASTAGTFESKQTLRKSNLSKPSRW